VVVGIRRGRGCVGVVGHGTHSSTYQVVPLRNAHPLILRLSIVSTNSLDSAV
jgi:hypothetical protein